MASWAAIAQKEPVKAAEAPLQIESKPKVAVIDANAIISGDGLMNLMRFAERVVTIPEVLKEVRDKQSRSILAALPFKIETQEPSDESLKAVIKFARATGDLHALSAVDNKLLALARTIEVSYYGPSHLRDLPAPPKVQKKRAVDHKTLPGWGAEGGDWAEMDRLNAEEEAAAVAAIHGNGNGNAELPQEQDVPEDSTTTTSRIAAGVQELTLNDDAGEDQQLNEAGEEIDSESEDEEEEEEEEEEEGANGEWEVAAKTRNKARRAKKSALRKAAWEAARAAEAADEEEGEGEWEEVGEGESMSDDSGDSSEGEEEEEEEEEEAAVDAFESAVCSLTADFAMQNVLLQMGLRLVTPDGRRISTVSRWVLRCTACMQVTKEVGRMFCPRCGNATLDRVRVVVGADGAEQYGVRKKHVLRGTKFSLPKPKGGRLGRAAEPILREDQLLTKKHLLRAKKAAAAKAELDPFAPEYTDETWHQVGAVLAGSKSATALLGGWKKNPNERKHIATNRRRK